MLDLVGVYEKESSFPRINRLTAGTSVTRTKLGVSSVTRLLLFARRLRNCLILSMRQLND